ncbi:MarC family protein [Agaribacterium haliotis]|uniref:MarC family protein n=1 Tax=Agaribacterium haliotis TaxID=2013869 RepID=UPI000BB578D0|nr:MarC family protein [Agaribacterium haliotis]
MELSAAILTIFLLIDPIGNIPIFLSVLGKVEQSQRRKVFVREMVIGLVILMLFLVAGRHILDALHLSVAAIQLSGAVVLFLIALSLVFPREKPLFQSSKDELPLIVPLAMPMIAGPSTIAVLVLLASSEPESLGWWVVALTIAWLASFAILACAQPIANVIGKRGIAALERLVGMLLIMLSAQMFIDSLTAVKDTWMALP